MASTFPASVVFGSLFCSTKFEKETTIYSPIYLGCVHNRSDTLKTHIKFDFRASDSAAKFGIEPAIDGGGLVHIKSFYNNKYWCRKDGEAQAIVAEADEAVEDKSSSRCTLFEIRDIDSTGQSQYWNIQAAVAGKRRVMFRHVQSDCFLSIADYNESRMFLTTREGWKPAECTLVDYKSLVTLPRLVVFKAHDGNYLTSVETPRAPMVFNRTELSSKAVVHEVYQTGNNLVRFKNVKADRFWMPKSDKSVEPYPYSKPEFVDAYTFFEVVKVDAEQGTVALRHVDSKKYCRADGNSMTLRVTADTITKDAIFRVVEPVRQRTIKEMRFHWDEMKIHNQSPDTLILVPGLNDDYKETDELKLEQAVEYTVTRSWSHTAGLMLGVETKFEAGIPLIAKNETSVKVEANYEHQWGKTEEEKKTINVCYTMRLGPRTKGTLKLVATKSTCEIPFSYLQIDTLSNEEVVERTLDNGVYKGVEFHEFRYEANRESLDEGNLSGERKPEIIPIQI